MSSPTPLDILLSEMRRKWDANDKEGAVALARLAAPYLHPRVQPTKPAAEMSKLTDADLDQLCGTDGAAAPDESPP